MAITWTDHDGRLTIGDLADLARRALTLLCEPPMDEHMEENAEILDELHAIVDLCNDAAMTAGKLEIPA